MNHPDLFTNVHKGLRRALFETCIALGKVTDPVPSTLRAQLRGVLHFIRHHGQNEDVLLLPLLVELGPVHARMQAAHAGIDAAVGALELRVDRCGAAELYHHTCELTARYLEHMREEELELEPQIRAALSAEQLASFGRGSIARTPPDDARMMLAWMLPAMPVGEATEMIARLPAELQSELRALV